MVANILNQPLSSFSSTLLKGNEMKPQTFFLDATRKLDSKIVAEFLGVSSRQVRKARNGAVNSATEAAALLSGKEAAAAADKLREKQEKSDEILKAHRASRFKSTKQRPFRYNRRKTD